MMRFLSISEQQEIYIRRSFDNLPLVTQHLKGFMIGAEHDAEMLKEDVDTSCAIVMAMILKWSPRDEVLNKFESQIMDIELECKHREYFELLHNIKNFQYIFDKAKKWYKAALSV